MVAAKWTTAEQEALLLSRVPLFIEAQNSKTLDAFRQQTEEVWLATFVADTSEDLSDESGKEDTDTAKKDTSKKLDAVLKQVSHIHQ